MFLSNLLSLNSSPHSIAIALAVAFLSTSLPLQAKAQEVGVQHTNLDSFCNQSPSNAICQEDLTVAQRQENAASDQLINELNEANQIIRLRLDVSGPRNEWIRIERRSTDTETILRAYHTKQVRQELISNITSGLLDFGLETLAGEVIDGYDGPVPSPGISFYRWEDHQTRRIVFVPDSCSSDVILLPGSDTAPNCAIVGTDSITLPNGTDLRSGLFILEYQEQQLVRTIAFNFPEEES